MRAASRPTARALSGAPLTDSKPVEPQKAGVELSPTAAAAGGWFISFSNGYLGYWG